MRIAFLLLIAAAVATLAYDSLTVFRYRRAIDAARRESEALKNQREALREEAFELGAQATHAIERGRFAARAAGIDQPRRSGSSQTPSRNAADESILAWLSVKSAQLESLEADHPPAGDGRGWNKRASFRAPARANAASSRPAEAPIVDVDRSNTTRSESSETM
jgi:hypothetical protein